MTYGDLHESTLDERLAEQLEKAESKVREARLLLESATRKADKAKAENETLKARIGRIDAPAPFLVNEMSAASARADTAITEQQKLEKELQTAEGHRDELQLARDQLDGVC